MKKQAKPRPCPECSKGVKPCPKSPTRLAAERLWEKIKLSDTDAVDAIAEAMEGLRGGIK